MRKPDPAGGPDGTRPIAAGETLRRLTAKVLMQRPEVTKELRTLSPLQCGVGVSGACGLLSMGLQHLVNEAHGQGRQDWAVLQLDFRNAFNSLQRSVMLEAVSRRCPPAYTWIRSCYSEHTPLYCGSHMIPSCSGVQQGDPCGPAAFAWGIHDLVEDMRAADEWGGWYLDDAHILGTLDQLHRAITLVEVRGRALGLQLNLSKCVLWGPAVTDNNANGRLPPSVDPSSPLHRTHLVPFGLHTGIRALGVPVCHPGNLSDSDFAHDTWRKRVDAVQRMCDALGEIPEAHIQFTLLRMCLSAAKVMDLLRAAPFLQAGVECARFSALLRNTLGAILGAPVSDQQWAQATLAIRHGGLGILDPTSQRLAARIAGIVDFSRRGAEVLQLQSATAHLPGDWPVCLTRALLSLGNIQPLTAWQADPSLLSTADQVHRAQSWWAERIHLQVKAHLGTTLPDQEAVRFAS